MPAVDRISFQTHVEGTAKQLATGVVGVALLLFSQGGTFNALYLFYALVPILGAMEHTGVLIDVDLLGAMSREFAGDMQRLAALEAAREARDVLAPLFMGLAEEEGAAGRGRYEAVFAADGARTSLGVRFDSQYE